MHTATPPNNQASDSASPPPQAGVPASTIRDSQLPSSAEAPSPRYSNIGGWLTLLCFVLLVYSPLTAANSLRDTYQDLAPLFSERPVLFYAFVLDGVLNFAVVSFGLFAGVRLAGLHARAVRTGKQYLVAILLYNVTDVAFTLVLGTRSMTLAEVSGELVGALLGFAVWYQYLRKSKRVRATYPSEAEDVDSGPVHIGWHRVRVVAIAAVTLVTGGLLGLGLSLRHDPALMKADVTAPVATSIVSRTNEWKEYISSTDDFSITFPGTPTRNERTDTIDGEPIPFRTYEFASGDEAEYAVLAAIYPESIDGTSLPPHAVLQVAVETLAKNASGRIRSQEATRVQGYPASDVIIDVEDAVSRARVVLAENRLFVIMQVVGDLSEGSGSYARFRESFQISPR